MHLSLGQAAKVTGKSKSIISKAIKTGKLSVMSKDTTGYRIDPAELFRVFPKEPFENGQKERLETPLETPENTLKIKELEIRLEVAHERLREKDQHIAEIRADLEKWREQAQRLALAPPATHTPEPRRRGWLNALFGKG